MENISFELEKVAEMCDKFSSHKTGLLASGIQDQWLNVLLDEWLTTQSGMMQ